MTRLEAGPRETEEFPQEPSLDVESPGVLDTGKKPPVEQSSLQERIVAQRAKLLARMGRDPAERASDEKKEEPMEKKEKQRVDDVGEAEAQAYAEKHFRDTSREPDARKRFEDEKTFLGKQRITDRMAEVLGDAAGEKYKAVKEKGKTALGPEVGKGTAVAEDISDEKKEEARKKIEQLPKEISPKTEMLTETQFQKSIRELKTGRRKNEDMEEEDFQASISKLEKEQQLKGENIKQTKGATLESLKGDGSVFNEPGVLENIVEGVERTSKIDGTVEVLDELINKETPNEKIERNVEALHEMREARERTEKPEKTEVGKKELSPEDKILFQQELLGSFAGFIDEIKYRLNSPDIPVRDKSRAEVKYGRARVAYRELTGNNLNSDAKKEALTDAKKEGHEIRTQKEYFSPESINKVREKKRHEMWSVGIKSAWDRLSEQEKAKWNEKSAQDKITQNKTDGGARHFARQLEADRKQLEKSGFTFSRDAYFKLFEEGYDPRTIKQTGLLFWEKITMNKAGAEKPEAFKLDDFEAKNKAIQDKFNQDLNKTTTEKMQATCVEGRSRWMKRKLKAAGDIVLESTKEYQADEANKEATPNLMEQAVMPEVVASEEGIEAEDRNAEKEYVERSANLAGVIAKTAKMFGLDKTQVQQLEQGVGADTEWSEDFIPQEVIKGLRETGRRIRGQRDKRKMATRRFKIEHILKSLSGI